MFRVPRAWKEPPGSQSNHGGTPLLDMRLQQQQVGILPALTYPPETAEGKVVSALVSRGEAVSRKTIPHIFICCHCRERCTCISTNNVVFITLGSNQSANPLGSRLLFSSFIFANEVAFGSRLAAIFQQLLSVRLNLGHIVSA